MPAQLRLKTHHIDGWINTSGNTEQVQNHLDLLSSGQLVTGLGQLLPTGRQTRVGS